METLTRIIPATDFPDPESCTFLTALENHSHNSHVPFKAEHHQKKHRIIRSLHSRIFFTNDSTGYPLKILMPQRYTVQVGYMHLFYVADWVDIPPPMGLRGIEWPPRSADGLLRADGSERCAGCEMRANKEQDLERREYCLEVAEGDALDFFGRNGMVENKKAVNNVEAREVVVVDVAGAEVEVPWLVVCVPEVGVQGSMETLSARTSVSGESAQPRPIETGDDRTAFNDVALLCGCDISRWHKFLQPWHERFELQHVPLPPPIETPQITLAPPSGPLSPSPISRKPIPPPEEGPETTAIIRLISKTYIPPNRPIGELIGVLKPNLSIYPANNPRIRARTLSPEPRVSNAERIHHQIDIPVGTLPPTSSPHSHYDNGDDHDDQDSYAAWAYLPTIYIDNHAFANFTRFIRHSCDPNVERHTSCYGTHRMDVFFTRRAIWPRDEVTEDLGVGYVRELGVEGSGSGSAICRMPRKGLGKEGKETV
ncbi:hypothetical protein K458DRAFT_22336 [Lentithecium fluviatile CBS 122367]|uniref:SET domain-containing protein n=1 Tax=Lentithecium fluviatile CBS 122367 TaxID=1168545 RepID=A0A6G1J4X2_9PLEO|nr:hypothetical protein K458DRAFT_22336 [Lentithecium fluviatile CBS 122367]